MSDSWISRFEGLQSLEPEIQSKLEGTARHVRLPAGARVFGPGQAPTSYLLLLGGDIRVSQVSEAGREIVLYRVLPGESCALTTACLIGGEPYQAEAITETEAEAVAIPRAVFDDIMGRSPVFRRFVLAGFSGRLTDLFKLVDEIAFRRMDARIAHKLLELAGPHGTLAMTHQQIAVELGTAREVVSRQLNELQRRGWVRSGRGSVDIVDRPALERLAGEAR